MLFEKMVNHFMKPLTDQERETYQWQMWVPEIGEAGQQKLKNASVMISRVGGVGSVVAQVGPKIVDLGK